MSDLIDRKVASDALRELFKYYVSTGTGKFTFIDAIDTSADVQKVIKQIPTVEATQEETKIAEFLKGYTAGKQDAVVHAHWIHIKPLIGKENYRCSNCNQLGGPYAGALAYCGTCGAKMDEEVQDDV